MAFASIKVREEDKREFDRLLHEVALRTGSAPSQHELFYRILEHALASKKSLLGRNIGETGRSWAKFQFELSKPTDAASDLDRVVYGLEP